MKYCRHIWRAVPPKQITQPTGPLFADAVKFHAVCERCGERYPA